MTKGISKFILIIFLSLSLLIGRAQDSMKKDSLGWRNLYDSAYGKKINPHNTTRLWTMYLLKSDELIKEQRAKEILGQRYDSLFNTFKELEKDFYSSLIDKKNLEQDLKNHSLLNLNIQTKSLFTIIQAVDSLRNNPDFDTLTFVNKVINSINGSYITRSKIDTFYINYPVHVNSHYYKKDSLKIRLYKDQQIKNQPFILYDKNIKTTPYLITGHEDFKILGTKELKDKKEWTIFYMSKGTDDMFSIEVNFTGYQILGKKALITVQEPKNKNLFNWFICVISSAEVILVIIITLLVNLNKIIEELKKLINIVKIKKTNT